MSEEETEERREGEKEEEVEEEEDMEGNRMTVYSIFLIVRMFLLNCSSNRIILF